METIGRGLVSRDQFLKIAEEIVRRFLALPENPDKSDKGWYVCLMREPRKILLVAELGNYEGERAFDLCQEKVRRLRDNPEHISSWQSRDPEKGKYGGAITAVNDSVAMAKGEYFGSISGLVEKGDEAAILMYWLYFRWINMEDVRKITTISNNDLFVPLFLACHDLFT